MKEICISSAGCAVSSNTLTCRTVTLTSPTYPINPCTASRTRSHTSLHTEIKSIQATQTLSIRYTILARTRTGHTTVISIVSVGGIRTGGYASTIAEVYGWGYCCEA